ncbi:MAG: hypothetical protein ABIZ52_00950 [Candidatus Limnocylindrales bacterium]
MTEEAPNVPKGQPASNIPASRQEQLARVVRYFERNHGRFTEEVLAQRAREQGYPSDVIDEARGRLRQLDATQPTRSRARRWILAAYVLTFAVLVIGMVTNEAQRSISGVGAGVLAMTLGIAYLISRRWLRWRGRKLIDATTGFTMLLSVPVILLVIVAGLCVASGLPISLNSPDGATPAPAEPAPAEPAPAEPAVSNFRIEV